MAIAGMVFGAEAERGETVGQVDYLLGRETVLAIQAPLEGGNQPRSRMLATIIGALTFIITPTTTARQVAAG